MPENINADVELLIEQHVPEALEPTKIKTHRDNGPYVTKTMLG